MNTAQINPASYTATYISYKETYKLDSNARLSCKEYPRKIKIAQIFSIGNESRETLDEIMIGLTVDYQKELERLTKRYTTPPYEGHRLLFVFPKKTITIKNKPGLLTRPLTEIRNNQSN